MLNFIIGILVGAVIAFLGTEAVGYTAAIAAPIGLFQTFGSSLGLFVWDTVVVQFLGFGVLSFFLTYLAVKQYKLAWIPTVVVAFIATQVFLFFLNGMVLSLLGPLQLILPHLMILILALCAGGYWGSKDEVYKTA